jgi:hypothetical protein
MRLNRLAGSRRRRDACRWVRQVVLAISIVAIATSLAWACNVPVFRFALERWRPDPYRVVLFHEGELTAEQREILRPLIEHQEKEAANVAVRTADLAVASDQSEEAAAERALYEAIGKPTLPWLVVQYPAHLRIPTPAWAGPLHREVVAAAIDSPIRREVARRLADGQSAVWLLLEGGQTGKDDAAAELLEEQLKLLQQTVKLPELTADPEDAIDASLPLKLEFSLVRVPRNDPAEHATVAMLVGSEPDLAERSDPMVFPVFGKGRALLPLIGAGITAKNIEDAASFLAGPCSCEVKEQNPGFDLLMATDWGSLLSDRGVSLTAIETRHAPPTGEPELVPIPTGTKLEATVVNKPVDAPNSAEAASPTGPSWLLGALALGGALVLLVLFVAVQSKT